MSKAFFCEKKRKTFLKQKKSGFTLLEVLVGLAILAIALATVLRVSKDRTETLEYLRARVFASWVMQNKIAELQISPDSISEISGEAKQEGESFFWSVSTGEASILSKARPITVVINDTSQRRILMHKQWIFPPVQIEEEHLASDKNKQNIPKP